MRDDAKTPLRHAERMAKKQKIMQKIYFLASGFLSKQNIMG